MVALTPVTAQPPPPRAILPGATSLLLGSVSLAVATKPPKTREVWRGQRARCPAGSVAGHRGAGGVGGRPGAVAAVGDCGGRAPGLDRRGGDRQRAPSGPPHRGDDHQRLAVGRVDPAPIAAGEQLRASRAARADRLHRDGGAERLRHRAHRVGRVLAAIGDRADRVRVIARVVGGAEAPGAPGDRHPDRQCSPAAGEAGAGTRRRRGGSRAGTAPLPPRGYWAPSVFEAVARPARSGERRGGEHRGPRSRPRPERSGSACPCRRGPAFRCSDPTSGCGGPSRAGRRGPSRWPRRPPC